MAMKKFRLPEIPFTGIRKYTYIISAVLIFVSLLSIAINRGLKPSIDFTGGIVLQVHFNDNMEISELRNAVTQSGYPNATIQRYGTANDFLIKIQDVAETSGDSVGPIIKAFDTYPNPTAGEKSVAVRITAMDEKSPIKNIFIKSSIFSSVQEVSAVDKYDSREEAGTFTFSTEQFSNDTLVVLKAFATDYANNVGIEKDINVYVTKTKKTVAGMVNTEWQDTTAVEQKAVVVFSPSEKLVTALTEIFKENQIRIDREEVVGAVMSKELQLKSLWVVLLGLAGILIYVWIRFTFRFGVASVIALFHDVLITLGIFSVLGKEMSIPIIAALLTLIGYSINDSIIVSDRIRENVKLLRKDTYDAIINRSLNQTLNRTIITSLTTLLVLISLFIFGGSVIHDFAFALIVGIVVGTYSSDFIVAPIVLDWEKRYPTRKSR